MSAYGTREVADVLGLTPRQVRAFVYAGLLAPARGPKNHYRFSFQDLVMLRLGGKLVRGHLARPRVTRALKAIPRYLRPGVPLASVDVDALGETVIARDPEGVWDPESGQRYFDFTLPIEEAEPGDDSDGAEVVSLESRRRETTLPHSAPVGVMTSDRDVGCSETANGEAAEWFDRALALEEVYPDRAKAAYRRAVLLDGSLANAHANLGRMLYQEGRLHEAARHFGRAFELDSGDATAAYNLGIAFEDLGNQAAALESYRRAVESDPSLAAAHFNLSRLYEASGDRAAALRHLAEYRRLESRD